MLRQFRRAPGRGLGGGATQTQDSTVAVDHVANMLIAALVENMIHSSSSIEYIHAMPDMERDITWGQVHQAVITNAKEDSDLNFSSKRLFNEGGKVLWTIGGTPFQFSSTKRRLY